jgi:hypothetical protein
MSRNHMARLRALTRSRTVGRIGRIAALTATVALVVSVPTAAFADTGAPVYLAAYDLPVVINNLPAWLMAIDAVGETRRQAFPRAAHAVPSCPSAPRRRSLGARACGGRRCIIGSTDALSGVRLCGSDRKGQLGERGSNPRDGRCVESQFLMAASDVLHEGVSGDDDAGCSVGAQAAHRSQTVLELAVISFDPVVGVSLDVVPRGGEHFVEHGRVGGGSVGDDLARLDLHCGQGPLEEPAGSLAALRLEYVARVVEPAWTVSLS